MIHTLLLALPLLCTASVGVPPLHKYNITGDLSVSGISAGGFMSVQLHVAFSNSIKHAGIVAGGPYWCSHGNAGHSVLDCNVDPGGIDLNKLYDYTAKQVAAKTIDSSTQLKGSKAIMWSGKIDTVVPQGTMKKARDYYEHYGVEVTTFFNFSAEHGWPTNYWGNACPILLTPFIVNCHYDYAGYILREFYPEGWNHTRGVYHDGNMLKFEQAPFRPKGHASLEFTGYIYVPNYCKLGGSCRLHINLHGCGQNAGVLGTDYVKHTGLNQWAESNRVIILYPQVGASVPNPAACWDFFGYTGKDFALKSGKQMNFIREMVTHIGAKMN